MNIQTLTLTSLIFSGRHGVATIERAAAQAFSIDVALSFDCQQALSTGKIEDTIDYRTVVEIIRSVIEGSGHPCLLLEQLANRIHGALVANLPLIAAQLTVQKIQTSFCQSISIAREYYSKRAVLGMKSFEEMHDALCSVGAASTAFLCEEERGSLVEEATKAVFLRQSTESHASGVKEDVSFCTVQKESDIFRTLADRVVEYLYEMEKSIGVRLFDQPLTDKEASLQKYEAHSFGITPHRDEKKYSNVVCIIPLKGKGVLSVCEDREANGAVAIDTTPGNLILLRAPGYMGSSVRPLHFVKDITEERIILGIRFPRKEE